MKKLNNKKGFTLIELLAVIVILAVLILLALPNVLKLMDNAKKDAFEVEAGTIIEAAKQAYTAGVVNGTSDSTTCWNYDTLKDYVDIKDDYYGFVERDPSNDEFKITLYDANNNYLISKQTKNNAEATKPETAITTPETAASLKCPTES